MVIKNSINLGAFSIFFTLALAQWVRAFASGRLSVRIPAATDLSRKTDSDSSTAKRSAIGVSVMGPRR